MFDVPPFATPTEMVEARAEATPALPHTPSENAKDSGRHPLLKAKADTPRDSDLYTVSQRCCDDCDLRWCRCDCHGSGLGRVAHYDNIDERAGGPEPIDGKENEKWHRAHFYGFVPTSSRDGSSSDVEDVPFGDDGVHRGIYKAVFDTEPQGHARLAHEVWEIRTSSSSESSPDSGSETLSESSSRSGADPLPIEQDENLIAAEIERLRRRYPLNWRPFAETQRMWSIDKRAICSQEVANGIVDDFYLNLLDWGKQNLIAVASGASILLYNADEGTLQNSLDVVGRLSVTVSGDSASAANESNVTSLRFSSDGSEIAVGNRLGQVDIWDIETQQVKASYTAHTHRVGALDWYPGHRLLTSGSRDKTILTHDPRSPSLLRSRHEKHKQEICGLRWRPANDQLPRPPPSIWDLANPMPSWTYPSMQSLPEPEPEPEVEGEGETGRLEVELSQEDVATEVRLVNDVSRSTDTGTEAAARTSFPETGTHDHIPGRADTDTAMADPSSIIEDENDCDKNKCRKTDCGHETSLRSESPISKVLREDLDTVLNYTLYTSADIRQQNASAFVDIFSSRCSPPEDKCQTPRSGPGPHASDSRSPRSRPGASTDWPDESPADVALQPNSPNSYERTRTGMPAVAALSVSNLRRRTAMGSLSFGRLHGIGVGPGIGAGTGAGVVASTPFSQAPRPPRRPLLGEPSTSRLPSAGVPGLRNVPFSGSGQAEAPSPLRGVEAAAADWPSLVRTSANVLASGGNDNKVYIWELGYSTPVVRISAHAAAVKALAWAPVAEPLLATGGGTNDRTVRIWDMRNAKELALCESESQVCNLVWSPETLQLVSSHGYTLNQINIWHVKKRLAALRYRNSALRQAANPPVDRPLALGKTATLTGHTSRVLYMTTNPRGTKIASAAGDGTLKVWKCIQSGLGDVSPMTGDSI